MPALCQHPFFSQTYITALSFDLIIQHNELCVWQYRGISHIHRISSVKRNQWLEFMRFSILTTQFRQKRRVKQSKSKRWSAKSALYQDSMQFR